MNADDRESLAFKYARRLGNDIFFNLSSLFSSTIPASRVSLCHEINIWMCHENIRYLDDEHFNDDRSSRTRSLWHVSLSDMFHVDDPFLPNYFLIKVFISPYKKVDHIVLSGVFFILMLRQMRTSTEKSHHSRWRNQWVMRLWSIYFASFSSFLCGRFLAMQPVHWVSKQNQFVLHYLISFFSRQLYIT